MCREIYRVWSVINSTRLDRGYDNFQSSVAGSISVLIIPFIIVTIICYQMRRNAALVG